MENYNSQNDINTNNEQQVRRTQRTSTQVRSGSSSRSTSASGRSSSSTGRSSSSAHRSQSSTKSRTASSGHSSQPVRRKKRKKDKFKKRLLIFIAILVVVLIVFTIVFSSFLSSYENSQPFKAIESVISEFQTEEGIINFLTANESKANLLDSMANVAGSYAADLSGKKISYIENENYRSDRPSYYITADGAKVAEIAFEQTGTTSFGNYVWGVASLDIGSYLKDTLSYTVSVPSGSTVTVNGTVLSSDRISSTGIPSVLESSEQFIENVPSYDTYMISGITTTPTVSVTDQYGSSINVIETSDSFIASDLTTQEFIDSVDSWVLEAIDNWATYFIAMSWSLSNYVKYGSDLYAYIFGSDDMDPIYTSFYNFEEIAGYEFTEKSASNYVRYSEDCFTVDVKYQLDVYFTVDSYSDNNQNLDATWVFVKETDGTWAISECIYK